MKSVFRRFNRIFSGLILCLFISILPYGDSCADNAAGRDKEILLTAVDDGGYDSASILIKEFVFVRPNKPPDSGDMVDLKARRRQIMSMYNAEKRRLEKASQKTKKYINSHLNFLESSLDTLDNEISQEGDTLIPIKALQDITRDYQNRELTLEEMNEVAELITMAYQEEGYILARAQIPEQEIEDGILEIAILEGDLGDIKVTGNKYYNERVLKRNFNEQLKHGVIKEDLLEKGFLLTKEIPEAETRILLEQGDKPGTANISLQAEDHVALKWNIDANNFSSELVGLERYGTDIEITEPWWGSTVALRVVSGNKWDSSGLYSGEFDLPLGDLGTSLTGKYIRSQYAIARS